MLVVEKAHHWAQGKLSAVRRVAGVLCFGACGGLVMGLIRAEQIISLNATLGACLLYAACSLPVLI